MLQNEYAVIVIRNLHLSNVVLHESPEEIQKLNSIAEILAPLTAGAPISHDVLTVIPLHREENRQVSPSIKMLAQAIAEETVEVTEISEDGSVPSIHANSLDDASILILDGEELIGAKQNRIANLTILIPPHASLNIPVSCVEAGRWSSRSRRFKSSGHMQFTEARAHKAASVSESLRFHKSYQSDQEEVWDDVDSLLDRLNVNSESRSMSDVYELYHKQLEVYERALHIPAEAVGAVFLIRGELTGLELFGSHEILARAWPKLLCSYAMQALAEGASSNENAIEPKPFEAFLKRLQACQVETHQGVGLGTDLRLDSMEVTGGGLLLDQDVIHLYAFVQPPRKVEQQELY